MPDERSLAGAYVAAATGRNGRSCTWKRARGRGRSRWNGGPSGQGDLEGEIGDTRCRESLLQKCQLRYQRSPCTSIRPENALLRPLEARFLSIPGLPTAGSVNLASSSDFCNRLVRQGRRVLAGPELGHEVLTDREALRDGVRGRSASLAQLSLALARIQRSDAAIALTIRECIEGRDQAEMALRMMQLQVKTLGRVRYGRCTNQRWKLAVRSTMARMARNAPVDGVIECIRGT